jgi:hypothetical protein
VALQALSDEKALALFKAIATTTGDDNRIILSKIKVTSNQYYSRLSHLAEAELVKRHRGRYFLTTIGRIAYECVCLLEKAFDNNYYCILKAIDLIEASQELSKKEYVGLIYALINNEQMRQALLATKTEYYNSNNNNNNHILRGNTPRQPRYQLNVSSH